ncbi:helix-turn-helix domain-containing protein [Saccharospirillum impatiens]|uniref:helix-turn-helix domain-containing protein n=1 Tax=Saccharospirillum impatiens TaxID=169438 RepID=UPI000415D64E|nr:helix-turn-helix domain-containing protein [Saccharospirillum impatiens]
MNDSTLQLPIQRHLDLVDISYPRSTLTWTAPKQDWRHFAQCILLLSGRGKVRFKSEHLELLAPTLLWSPAGMMLGCDFSAGSHGELLTVSEDWLIPAVSRTLDPKVPFRSMADALHEVPLTNPALLDRLAPCFSAIRSELADNEPGAQSVVAAQLTTLLALIHRQQIDQATGPETDVIHSTLFQRFLGLIELHFRDHWKVADYTHHMGVSERRLEFASQRDVGKTPSMIIQRKLISEACQRLAHSPLSVAEVAYGLGFKDPAYFNRFFKRHMDDAPGTWRRKIRKEAPSEDTTFAAWP